MEKDFFAAVALIIEETWNSGNKTLAQKMVTTRNCFGCFVGGERLPFVDFTGKLVGDFERWLLEERRVSAGTAAVYVRELSIIYSRILDKGWAADTQPFKGASLQCRSRVATDIVTLDVIVRIRDANLTALPPEMSLARDLFMLCFYLGGMHFRDMAMLRKDMLRDGWLMTGDLEDGGDPLRWQACMQDIVDRHPTLTPYLLPIVADMDKRVSLQIRRAEARAKECLVRLTAMVGSPVTLSFVVARHSWREIRDHMTPLQLICTRFTPEKPAQITGCRCCCD